MEFLWESMMLVAKVLLGSFMWTVVIIAGWGILELLDYLFTKLLLTIFLMGRQNKK